MTTRQITVVASELLGTSDAGGAGTADSLLAVALGRHGHHVQLLIATGRGIGPLNAEWTRKYAAAGVEVRLLEQLPSAVEPPYLRPTLEVYKALCEQPPEVAIVNDWRGLGYAALRARQAGSALSDTAFIVHCHGSARVLAEFAQKVPDTLARFGEEVTERASLELADAVVSPSEWLLDWMRTRRWPVPETARVIPYLLESAALGESRVQPPVGAPIRRLVFFGQLREGKGIRIFLAGLDTLDPALLDGVELLFLGRESKRWTRDRISASLAPEVQERVGPIRFETGLDRTDALDELRRPGTLAVMPSLLDNAPNTVSECIEHGIPFVATRVGGIPELVAEDDRDRVLCAPSADDLAALLSRALSTPGGFPPAHPAHERSELLNRWLDLVAEVAPRPPRHTEPLERVAVIATGDASARRARRLVDRTRIAEVEVVDATSRQDGLERTSAEWIVFLDNDDLPDDDFLEGLVSAQAASGADAVTCAVRSATSPNETRLFLGDPGALGLLENHYGVVGLVRTGLAALQSTPDDGVDPDWPLLARMALEGARIVSIPEVLSTHRGSPGRVGDVPGPGLTVLRLFEEAPSEALRGLPHLVATLAAASADGRAGPSQAERQASVRRLLAALRGRARQAVAASRRLGSRIRA